MVPGIIPLIFYHGKRRFDLPENFIDYFKIKDKNIKEFLLNFKSIIFDTNRIDDEKILERVDNLNLLAGILSLKHIFDDIKELKPTFKTLINLGESGFLLFLEYIVISRVIDEEELKNVLKDIGGDKMPTLAEKWFEEGWQEGKQVGWQEGKQIGWQEGVFEGLTDGIRSLLKVKFKDEDEALFERIKNIKDIELLKKIENAIETAESTEEVERLLPDE